MAKRGARREAPLPCAAMADRQGAFLTPEEVLARHHGGPRSGVFTDGSCEGNPGPGGWGVVWVEDDRIVREAWGSDPATTNNRMELRALIEAYEMLPPDSETRCTRTVSSA
jgi:ribonuclease HI